MNPYIITILGVRNGRWRIVFCSREVIKNFKLSKSLTTRLKKSGNVQLYLCKCMNMAYQDSKIKTSFLKNKTWLVLPTPIIKRHPLPPKKKEKVWSLKSYFWYKFYITVFFLISCNWRFLIFKNLTKCTSLSTYIMMIKRLK